MGSCSECPVTCPTTTLSYKHSSWKFRSSNKIQIDGMLELSLQRQVVFILNTQASVPMITCFLNKDLFSFSDINLTVFYNLFPI